jgi:hypothetical protein
MSQYEDLHDSITKILIFSYYENEHGRGKTAEEILSFKDRAIDKFLGRDGEPGTVVCNTFHTRVRRDVGLIMSKIVECYDAEREYS